MTESNAKTKYFTACRGWKLSTRTINGRTAYIATRKGVSMNACTGDNKLSGDTLISMIDTKCREESLLAG